MHSGEKKLPPAFSHRRSLWLIRSGRSGGFTLVELLVVIGIIAVLTAMLAQTVTSAKAKAKLTKCMSNQRQIGYAFHMYAQDHNDYFPRHSGLANYGGGAGKNEMLGGATDPIKRPMNVYTLSAGIFECPADMGRVYEGQDYKSWWQEVGNSYITQWAGDGIIARITGDSSASSDDSFDRGRSGRLCDYEISPLNKVMQADAPWFTLRSADRPRLWHPPRSRKQVKDRRWPEKGVQDDFALFADNHVDFIYLWRYSVVSIKPKPTDTFW